jgi:hypothetical protein
LTGREEHTDGLEALKPGRLHTAMTKNYSADNTALLKILLHSAKYATSSVNGFLLGKASIGKDSVLGSPQVSPRPSGSGQATVSVLDAVPLGHSFLSLAPVIETALVQVPRPGFAQGVLFDQTLVLFSGRPYGRFQNWVGLSV